MGSTLHSDLLLADDGGMKDLATYDPRSTPWMKWLESDNQAAQMLAHNAAEEAAAASTLIVHRVATEGEPMAEDYMNKPTSPPTSDGSSGKELVFTGGNANKTGQSDEDDGGEVVRLRAALFQSFYPRTLGVSSITRCHRAPENQLQAATVVV